MQITLQNYKKLLTKIQKTIFQTKQNIVRNVNREKVVMSWEIGKEIELHLKENNRAGYGKKLFSQLVTDVGIEQATLYKMHSFYKTYPKLPDEKKALSWSHYRNLIAVKDAETRAQLENLVVQKNLGTNKLQQEISATKKVKKKITTAKTLPTKLRVTRGKLFTYSLTKDGEVDLGFNIFLEKTSATFRQAQRDSDVALSLREARRNSRAVMLSLSKHQFTYVAKLERVVDGDTIHVKLDLGFGIKHHEILRLAKINAPEAETKEGKRATVALKKILKDVDFLIVKTNKTDIYGRYIADVFFGEGTAEKVAESGEYLNQTLLDRGLVEVY
ncbi:MAG: thermonuclease family protein [Proteobacteria bacterium]|nr:thermonuclease family protein [Pseudomonadota bacterium]